MVMRNLLISIFIVIVSACTAEKYSAPQGPDGSWWLGGADGGVFVEIKDDNNVHDNIYTGIIYFDADQTIWYEGPFKLVGNLNFSVDNHDKYLAWDGERLYLEESSYLEAINPVPPL